MHTLLKNNLYIISRFYFHLHAQGVGIYKFYKMLIGNSYCRIFPRFCNNNTKHRKNKKIQEVDVKV